nr:hypothetical protein CFP56_69497 [Quercus suber]
MPDARSQLNYQGRRYLGARTARRTTREQFSILYNSEHSRDITRYKLRRARSRQGPACSYPFVRAILTPGRESARLTDQPKPGHRIYSGRGQIVLRKQSYEVGPAWCRECMSHALEQLAR